MKTVAEDFIMNAERYRKETEEAKLNMKLMEEKVQ